MQSPRMKAVLVRIFFFFLHSSALLALLPLVARELHGAGPGTYTVMLACIGGGAVVAAFYFPRWRARFDRDQFVVGGTLAHAAMSVIVVFAPNIWIALPAIVVLGMAWISTANSLTLAAQVALPNWVRARGMAIYQMALMGGAAAGSLLWGQVAGWTSVPIAVTAAAVAGPLLWLATRRLSVEGGADPDFSPVPAGSPPQTAISVAPDEGPVMVTLEYQVDPADAEAFADVMQKTRRARLRQGALSWGLFRDTAAPGRYIEYFVDESWVEHLRRLERFTVADAVAREAAGFHPAPGRRWCAASSPRACGPRAAGPSGKHEGRRRLCGGGRWRRRPDGGARAGAGRARGGGARGGRGHRHRDQLAQQRGHPRRAVLPAGFMEGAAVRARAPAAVRLLCGAWRRAPALRQAGRRTDAAQEPSLRDLRERAAACGVHDLQWLSAAEAQALEPALRCSAALLSPSTGIVDSHGLMLSLQGEAEALGAMLALQSPLQRLRRRADGQRCWAALGRCACAAWSTVPGCAVALASRIEACRRCRRAGTLGARPQHRVRGQAGLLR